jgi:hypothetical protein
VNRPALPAARTRRAAVASLALFAALAGAACDDAERAEDGTTTDAPPVASTRPEPADAPAPPTLLVWTSGGLPPGFGERVAALDGVERVTSVNGDLLDLVATSDERGQAVDAPPPGMRIPLDALAIDPSSYPAFVDEPARTLLTRLGPGEALLGATSARLRRLGTGGVVELANGARLTVAGVVDDAAVGAAELVVTTATGSGAGITTPRFLLLTYTDDRAATEQAIGALVPGTPVRFRAPEEARFLRHADLVLPQALVKERFGEFAYAPGTDRFITIDPAYEQTHVVTATVPILGAITCHRDVIPAIEGALRELEQRALSTLIDPVGYQGCFVPSAIPGSGGLSHHSWGIAIDVNFLPNPTGLPSYADPQLIAVMERWGFVAGARFLEVDPGHFEYLHPPDG